MYSRPAVVFVVAVPGRKIRAEAQAVLAAGVGNLADHVAVPPVPGAVLDRVLGVLAGPQAETVVMLAGEHQPAQAGRLGRADDLVGVEIGGIEDLLRFVAEAPFPVGKRVHAEMQEAINLPVMPGELPRAGHGAETVRGRSPLGPVRQPKSRANARGQSDFHD